MWIRVQELGKGQHPSEVVVGFQTADGAMERVIVDRRSLENDALEVGFPVGGDEHNFLVELPRETMHGQWRVWVPKTNVIEGVPA